MNLTLTCSLTLCSLSKGAGGRASLGWIPSLWDPSGTEGGGVNLVTFSLRRGASDVGLEEAESFLLWQLLLWLDCQERSKGLLKWVQTFPQ